MIEQMRRKALWRGRAGWAPEGAGTSRVPSVEMRHDANYYLIAVLLVIAIPVAAQSVEPDEPAVDLQSRHEVQDVVKNSIAV